MTSASPTRKTSQSAKKAGFLAIGAGLLAFKNFGGFLLKGGWLLKTGLSTLLSFAVYGFVFGWQYAAALIILILIHEFGHWFWMRCNNVNAEVPIFVPFVGAIIEMRKLPPLATTTAWTGLAGPLIGGAGAIIFWLTGRHLHNGALMAGGSFGFMLNLFQLIPATPLDGSWVLASISKWLLLPGTLLIIAMAVISKSPLLVIIAIISTVSLFKRPAADALSAAPEGAARRRRTLKELEEELVATTALAVPAATATAQGFTAKADTKTKRNWKMPPFDPERCAILVAYLILTGMLAFLSVESIRELNESLHIENPVTYLRAHKL